MEETTQNPRVQLRPWMVAIMWLCAGAMFCTLILSIDLDSPEFQSLSFTVYFASAVILACIAIIIAISPAPEWSSTAKRLCGIGFIMVGSAYSIAETFHSTTYGLIACAIGIIILLIAVLYPGAIKDSAYSE